jgi:L,D-transpeptidase catalytic domain
MSALPRHRQPTHRSRRPRLPRVALVLGVLIGCLGLSSSVLDTGTPADDNTVTRAIDPAIGERVVGDRVVRVRRVQSEISPDLSVPSDSGRGRRVVYSETRQRVWLVAEDERVESTYLVSGSAYDNLEPGTFEVYSRSEQARSFDGGSTMAHFVRFTKGPTGAAIGFHDIPRGLDGQPLQTADDLGQPLSHGCIRQSPEDALTLWEFAPLGTTVVVTE